MATENINPAESHTAQENVFVRLLGLPVVSSTYGIIEKTYTTTKHTHPLICTVCEVYEKGAKTATSLAVWSIQPAIHKLEPQIVAVNSLACKGLDRLEEKIPALQYPPEKLASGIAEVVTSTVQTAKNGLASPISSTTERAFTLVLGGYQLTKSTVSDTVGYLLSSRPVQVAEEGVDSAITLTESLVNYILPASPDERDKEASQGQGSDVTPAGQQPSSFNRLGALVSTIYKRAYEQTTAQLRRTRTQGQKLVFWVPGVAPMTGFARRNLEAVGSVLLAVQSSVSGLLLGGEEQQDKEKRKKKEGDLLETSNVQSLVSSLGQQLQSAYASVVSGVKMVPSSSLSVAKDTTGAVIQTLSAVKENMLQNLSIYILLPGMSTKEREEPDPVTEDEKKQNRTPDSGTRRGEQMQAVPAPEGPAQGPASPERSGVVARPEASDPACEKVLEQKTLSSGSSHREVRRGESPLKTMSSTYTRTTHTSVHSTAKMD
ncbi:perilipin-1 [Amia ocellicauda]|uniref:perilipin-1 n=1 Tax=Amia ocellicauda TaxID=2972642 RepID=UPI003464A5C0